MSLLTLLTDFGLRDYYVAAVKGTVLRLAPGAQIVDISHDVEPGSIEEAAFLLAAAAPSFPEGTVHLAVVDPGVGGARRLLVAETSRARFVAPDNGLLTPFLDTARVWSTDRPDLDLSAPGETFHGRDRFAPLAAALLRGEEPGSLGAPVRDAVRLPSNPVHREPSGAALGSVVHVDRFGNLVTDIPSEWLPGAALRLEIGAHLVSERAGHYAAMRPGVPTAVPGSLGTVELSLRGESLADLWQVGRGAAVRLAAPAVGGQG